MTLGFPDAEVVGASRPAPDKDSLIVLHIPDIDGLMRLRDKV